MNLEDFDFEYHKREMWITGLLCLSIIIAILAYFQNVTAIVVTSVFYCLTFGLVMVKLEINSKNQQIKVDKIVGGILVLESKTVVNESKMEESIFYVNQTVEYDDFSEEEMELLEEYNPTIVEKLKENVNSELLVTRIKVEEDDENPDALIESVFDINNWNIIKMNLLEADVLSEYQTQVFDSFYVISQYPNLNGFYTELNARINWGFRHASGTKIFGDLCFLGWILPNKPLFLLYNSPKIVYPLTNVRKTVDGVNSKTNSILKHEILNLAERQRNFDAQIDDKEKQIKLINKQKKLAHARAEFVETEHLERPDQEIDPNFTYVNKSFLYISLVANFMLGMLTLANYVGGM